MFSRVMDLEMKDKAKDEKDNMTESKIQRMLKSHHAYEDVVAKEQAQLVQLNKRLDATDLHLQNSDMKNENSLSKLQTNLKKQIAEHLELMRTV